MRRVEQTPRFRRDIKRERAGPFGPKLVQLLQPVIDILVADQPLQARYRDHALVGNWKGHRDCHIRPDLVLIYRKVGTDILQLVRLGSHGQLGI